MRISMSVSSVSTEPFKLDGSKEFLKRMKAAKKRVQAMDASDGNSIACHDIDLSLRTVITALTAGLDGGMTDCIEDALIMVQQIEQTIRETAASSSRLPHELN